MVLVNKKIKNKSQKIKILNLKKKLSEDMVDMYLFPKFGVNSFSGV